MIDNDGILCEPQGRCPRCDSEGRLLHEGLVDPTFGAPGRWSLRRCPRRDCGLAWIDPMPRTDQIGKFYTHYYTHGEAGPNPILAHLASPRKKQAKDLLARIFFWRAALFRSDLVFLQGAVPGRLLDVGCGNGDLMVAARTLGWQPTGLDFDPAAVAAANALPGISARVGALVDAGLDAESFDGVTFNHVIEHLPNIAETFAEARRVLRPGGRLVMITPNIDAEGHRLFGRDWRGLEPPRHLHLFTPHLLRRYAREAGFGRVSAFSYSAGASRDDNILSSSAWLAAAAGRPRPSIDLKRVERREKLLDLIGIERGELAVLVAHR